jgi:copper chaperone NosL
MCGMKVVDHREWAGAIETGSGETFYFCSPRCTMATSRHAERFLGIGPEEIQRIRVTDYLRPERTLDAKTAYYVVDSDVRSPMGLDLLPAATQADAETLVRRHGGRVVRYDEVNHALLADLKERSRAAPPAAPH